MQSHDGHRSTGDADQDLASRGTPAQRAWFAFHRAMLGHRQLMVQKLAEEGIPPGQAMLLRELAHNDGISQRDLAERMHIARPTVTVMLQKIERSGLVERRPDESDQRITRVYATEAGRALQLKMRSSFAAIVEAAMGSLTEDEQTELERLLNILGDNFAATTSGPAIGCASIDELEAE